MSISHERLLSIGAEAATEIIGNVGRVDVAPGINEQGDPSYYFKLQVDQDRDRMQAMLLRTRLRQKIRDLLIAENDERYPYVRIIGDPE